MQLFRLFRIRVPSRILHDFLDFSILIYILALYSRLVSELGCILQLIFISFLERRQRTSSFFDEFFYWFSLMVHFVEKLIQLQFVHWIFTECVLQIRDVSPGSEFFNPGSRTQGRKESRLGSVTKNFSTYILYLTHKSVTKLLEIWKEIFIPDTEIFPSRIWIQGQKNTGSRIRNTGTGTYRGI
jgi:hypothetical protein